MTLRTITFDDEQWQLVPKQLTPEMLGAALWPACLATDYALALAAAPEPPAQEPGTAAEIEALRADSDRLRWLTEDHADPEARNKCREILGRMPVMSYSAACMVIDSARAALADGEEG